MNRKATRYMLLTIATFFLTIAFLLVYRQQSQAVNIPDTSEGRAVVAALTRAYQVLDTPFEQLDLNQLAEVLIDHPDFQTQLSADELEHLKQYTSKVQGDAALQNFGFLTAMRTKRMNQQHGAKLLSAAMERARTEGRELTPEEWKELTEQNYGMQPYLPPDSSEGQSTPFVRQLLYLDLKVDGDRAEIKFDTGAKNRRAILVRIDGRWYVAGIF
ncbi:MAG: hypothetical protein DCC55_05915 [Chloroflexi bacterium]|nr:MAG: hypothetical protein DCC55_05915 [Chloroflexota bacterium]